jgi:hypothetical protein
VEWVSDTDSIGVDVGALGWADPDAGCASRSGSSLPADPAAPGVRENRTGRPAPSHGRRCMEGTSLRSHRYTGRFRLRLGPHAECRVVSGPRRLSPIGLVTGVKWRRYPPHLDPHSESIGSDNCLVKIFAIASHPGDPPHTAADGLSQIPLSVQRIFAQGRKSSFRRCRQSSAGRASPIDFLERAVFRPVRAVVGLHARWVVLVLKQWRMQGVTGPLLMDSVSRRVGERCWTVSGRSRSTPQVIPANHTGECLRSAEPEP